MQTERHQADYEYQDRFPDLVTYARFEGGTAYLAGHGSPCHVIFDESSMADFMDEGDELIAIFTFDDPAERDAWLRKRVPRPHRR